MSRAPLRVVLDTNLVLSALVFQHGRIAGLRKLWQEGRIVPLVSRTTAAELIRALSYPKFQLSASEQKELLADYLPYCETVEIPNPPPVTPPCRDGSDSAFLVLALAGEARVLVTGDKDLLALAGSFACPIQRADEFLSAFGKT